MPLSENASFEPPKHELEVSVDEIARMNRSQRRKRVERLILRADELVRLSIETHLDARTLAAKAVLFSGGNDSTTMLHLMRMLGQVTHTIHVNTGIGLEETRVFVRRISAEWGIPLIEQHPPPGCTYKELVLAHGFPGPAHHYKMYQRLKERALDAARIPLGVHRSRKIRALYLAGRRREESIRRMDISLYETDGSVIWVSPFAEWTKLDLNTYRLIYDVPRNEVADQLHMSGECLCGSFAKPDELAMIGDYYPRMREEIEELEGLIADREDIPLYRRTWGWGAYKHLAELPQRRPSKVGRLCSSCKPPDSTT